jgi:hypothetical protein
MLGQVTATPCHSTNQATWEWSAKSGSSVHAGGRYLVGVFWMGAILDVQYRELRFVLLTGKPV